LYVGGKLVPTKCGRRLQFSIKERAGLILLKNAENDLRAMNLQIVW
jgi:hypothetical protein